MVLNLLRKTRTMILELPVSSLACKRLWSCLSHPHNNKKDGQSDNQQLSLQPLDNWGQGANHCPPPHNGRDRQKERIASHWNRSPGAETSAGPQNKRNTIERISYLRSIPLECISNIIVAVLPVLSPSLSLCHFIYLFHLPFYHLYLYHFHLSSLPIMSLSSIMSISSSIYHIYLLCTIIYHLFLSLSSIYRLYLPSICHPFISPCCPCHPGF